MIEAEKRYVQNDEEFPSDSSSNNAPNMMNIPEDDGELPQFGAPKHPNPYSAEAQKEAKKNRSKSTKEP
jgi:hypothetical protein